MKILITGAAGFIGSHLVDHLLSNGVSPSKIRLLILPGESLDNLPPDVDFDIIWGDIRDEDIVKKAMRGITVVYHLAAKIDFDGKSYEDYKDVNVDATRLLVEACKNKKITKFVFFSSIAVHGLPAGMGDIVNFDESKPSSYTNLYGKSKWEAENVIRDAHTSQGLPYAIIRPASVYGPREKGPTLALYRAIANKHFLFIGDGKNKMHYVYVTDLVAAARLAEKSRKTHGEYIIAGPKPTPFNIIVAQVAKSINVSTPNIRIPTTLAMLLAHVLSWVGKLLGISVPLFPSRVKTMTTSYYYNITKAQKELSYKPKVTFSRGAALTGAWYKKNGWL